MNIKFIFIHPVWCPALAALVSVTGAACGDGTAAAPDAAASSTLVRASDVPLDGSSKDQVRAFNDGDELFDLPFRPADGLGPLFIRSSCSACHDGAARGPGLVQKMAVIGPDGENAAADQGLLAFGHTVRRGLAAGALTPIVPPEGQASVRVSTRLGPPVLGRGYLEAILDSEIERVESEQAARTDGIHGRINRVVYASHANPDATYDGFHEGDANLIGRFGLKARSATLDDFTADAFQGDMGLTTPMRPVELPNPDGLTDDARTGVDLTIDHVNEVAFYLRMIAIPRRVGLTDGGRALFDAAACSGCHVPSMRTRPDYPIAQLAGIDAPIYSDLLLHDMGPALADGLEDGAARSAEWRTTPLVGVRFSTVFLHDGRAASVADAILAHDGEAAGAAAAFRALSAADQDALVRFVEAL